MQLKLNFFSDYSKRYQEIILNFPENINENKFDINKLPDKSKNKTLRYMRVYFDLCSEEYYLFREKYLDEKIWNVWNDGINNDLSKTAFKEAWKIIKQDTIFNPKFSELITEHISNIKKQKNTCC